MTSVTIAIQQAQATALVSVDDAIAGLCQVMGEYLGAAGQMRQTGKSPARALRNAARCLAPLFRLARHGPARLSEILRLARVTSTAAADETRRARDVGDDPLPYLDIRFTCQVQLARVAEAQAVARDKSAKDANKLASLHRGSAMPAAQALPKQATVPLTQRAKLLAEQRAKGRQRG